MPRHRAKQRDPVTRVKNRIRGAQDKGLALDEVRRSAELSVLDPLAKWSFGWLPTIGVLGRLTPKRLSDLNANPALTSAGLERDLEWATAAILRVPKIIERYLRLKRNFNEAVTTGSLVDAAATLDGLDRELGHSLQSLATRIALEQVANGLEAQKELITDLRRQNASPIVLFYAFWWSVRAEDGTTPEHFSQDIHRRLDAWDIDPDARAHVSYFLLNEYPAPGEERRLLSAATSGSVIDTYEMLVGLATAVAAERRESRGAFERALMRIEKEVQDERLTKLLVLLGNRDAVEGLTPVPVEHRTARLRRHPCEAPAPRGLEELYASQSNPEDAPAAPNELVGKLRSALNRLTSPGDEGARGALALTKLGLMFGHGSIGRWAAAVARAYAPRAKPFDPSYDGPRFVAANDGLLEAFSVLPHETAEPFAARIRAQYGQSAISAAASILGESASPPALVRELAEEERLFLELRRAAKLRDAQVVLDSATALLSHARTREAIFFKSAALLDLGKAQEALHDAVNLLVDEPLYNTWLPLEDLVRSIYDGDQNLLPDCIETPILFGFSTKYVTTELASYVSYTAEDFITSLGVDRPSAFDWANSAANSRLVIHFLSEVCTPTTLRLFTTFESERELEEERIAICQLLSRLDSENRERYEEEALGIVTSRLVKEAIKQLQASKISIDDPAIRVWADRNLREDFERYQSLHASGLVVVDNDYREALIQALETGEISKSLYEVPQNEAGTLFTQMVLRLVQECAFDPEHGLDCYLSLRIRHGTMSGVLRSAPEMEKVVTRRASETGDYRANTFWRDATAGQLDEETWELVEERLAKFSGDFDALIRELITEYIQVRRTEKPKGIISVDVPHLSIYGLASDISVETTFEEFIDKTIEIFWATVQLSLRDVRHYLDGEARDKFRSLFNNLEFEVRHEPALVPLADAVIRARNELELSLDRVRDWFDLPTTTAAIPFTLNQLIEVSLEAIKSFHRDFNPDIQMPASDIPHFVGALNLFSDIFFVVFENIYTHCGSVAPSVTITSEMGSRSLRVRIENTMAAERCAPENIERVAQSRERIRSGAYLSDLSREGGTGLPKLAKLVGYKSGQGELDFDLGAEAKVFWLEFSLPARILDMSDGGRGAAAIAD